MPVYVCPKCGFRKTAPEGTYYHKVCGLDAIMIEEEEYKRIKSDYAGRFTEVRENLIILKEDMLSEAPELLKKVGDKIGRAIDLILDVERILAT